MAKPTLARKLLKAKRALSPYNAGYKSGVTEGIRRVNEGIQYKQSGGLGYIGAATKRKMTKKRYA